MIRGRASGPLASHAIGMNKDIKACIVTLAYFTGLVVLGAAIKPFELAWWLLVAIILPGQMVLPVLALWLLGDLE